MGSVARVTEISARSDESFEAATRLAISRANQTLRNVRSGWIKEQRVTVEDGGITSFQVNLEVTFELDE
jgi:dodecin